MSENKIKSWRGGTEKKTRTSTLIFFPSVYEAIQKIAYIKHNSVNGLVGDILADYIKNNKEIVDEYDKLFSDNSVTK